ncbi:MAG TPA: response regulator transcription factor [Aggregatilineaceae bacterium]|nr:response regulator transcription factor [Aggregatilineaceae bacterium]
MTYILAVDDDAPVLRSVKRVLEKAGFEVDTAANGQEALDKIAQRKPDLVVLDIIMPGLDGIEVCRRIRADPFIARLPIVFLTAKGRPSDVAQGLDAGADDFITKPFEVIELPARVRALLRRAPGGVLDAQSEYLTVGDLKLHSTRCEVQIGERMITLTTIEHQLLHYLMIHAGQPIATEKLLQDVWQYPPGTGDPILVRVHIANLRSKIEPDSETPRYILNVRGRGYLFVN